MASQQLLLQPSSPRAGRTHQLQLGCSAKNNQLHPSSPASQERLRGSGLPLAVGCFFYGHSNEHCLRDGTVKTWEYKPFFLFFSFFLPCVAMGEEPSQRGELPKSHARVPDGAFVTWKGPGARSCSSSGVTSPGGGTALQDLIERLRR